MPAAGPAEQAGPSPPILEGRVIPLPLHRTAKGDNPRGDLAQLVRRIERGGGTVVQVIDTPTEWLVVAVHRGSDDWETRTS